MGVLYENIVSLCENKGIKPGRLCSELGLSRGLMTDLKMGRKKSLSAETADKIATYFNVSVSYLLGNEQKEKPVAESGGLNIEEMIKAIEEKSKRTVTIMGFHGKGQEHFELTPEQYEAFKTLFGNDKKE